jgi:RNA polymerase sigma-70 factor (ECF subfamily)
VGDTDPEDDPRRGYALFFGVAKASLMGQAYLLTGDVEEARDLVQETLLRAWKSWSQVSGYDDPQGWARRVLHNLAVSRWRRQKVRELNRFAAGSEMTGSEVAGPDADHIDVVNALHRLPVSQQRALVLHDVVGMSVVEVAAELEAPEGTVRSWLSRGRTALAKDLAVLSEPVRDERGLS